MTSEKLMLLDWVNSIDMPSCLLVSSMRDLQDGVVLCDIAASLTNSLPYKEVIRQAVPPDKMLQKALHNFQVLLSNVPVPDMKAEMLVENDTNLFYLLKFMASEPIAQISKGVTLGSSGVEDFIKVNTLVENRMSRIEKDIIPYNASPQRQNRASSQSLYSEKRLRSGQTSGNVSNATSRFYEASPERTPNRSMAISRASLGRSAEKPKVSMNDQSLDRTQNEPSISMMTDFGSAVKPSLQDASDEIKQRVIYWFEELSLIPKNSASLETFPSKIYSGALLCELVNRLEGKSAEQIKGINQYPKNFTATKSNVNKALDYIKRYPRMNCRYLWATDDIINGNNDVIWGLLDDMWHLYNHKTTHLYNPSQRARSPGRRGLSRRTLQQQSPSQRPLAQTYRTYMNRSSSVGNVTKNSQMKRSQSARKFDNRSSRVNASPGKFSKVQASPGKFEYDMVTPDMILRSREWVSSLQLGHYLTQSSTGLLMDPLRNGVLLWELMNVLENAKLSQTVYFPKTMQQCKQNIESALVIIEQRTIGIWPLNLLQTEKILKGDHQTIWGIIWNLMNIYPHSSSEIQSNPETLPYNRTDLKILERGILSWLYSLGVINLPQCPISLNQIIHGFKNGVTLCNLVSVCYKKKVIGVFRHPKTEISALSNIHKALEITRQADRMSKKFVWREQEILNGDPATILGLLEDIRRYTDLQPARRRGPGYHDDGPYVMSRPSTRAMSVPVNTHPKEYQQAFEPQVRPQYQSIRNKPAPQSPSKSLVYRSTPLNNSMQIPSKANSVLSMNTTPKGNTSFFGPHLNVSTSRILGQDLGLSPIHRYLTPERRETETSFVKITQKSYPKESDMVEKKKKITAWLNSIGYRTKTDWAEEYIVDFRTGNMLCDIVGILHGFEITGTQRNPKTSAAAMQNFNKAMTVLKTYNTMPSKYFFMEEKLLKGDGDSVRDLLLALSEVFRKRSSTLAKFSKT